MDLPWIEKYRPKTVDEVASQEEVVSVLKRCLQNGDLPHLLFYGPPGTGKTSTILALTRELYGPEYRQMILELNASDERGISVIREKVKNFSQLTANKGKNHYRIVILDEADSMTRDAQTCLRRIMEKYTRTTRFCLICNYVSKIIPPLNSRCSKFRFKPLGKDILVEKLNAISTQEGVKFKDEKDLEYLIGVSEGDMRRALTLLQCAHRVTDGSEISTEEIASIAGVIPDDIVSDIWKEKSLNSLIKKMHAFQREGFNADQLLTQFVEVVTTSEEIDDRRKAAILEKMAVVEHRLKEGSSEMISLMELASVIATA